MEVRDSTRVLHGLPGEGLLFPQITYSVSINEGEPGCYATVCEPPLVVKGQGLERFKVRLVDTGYAWTGAVQVLLGYARNRRLELPWLRIVT